MSSQQLLLGTGGSPEEKYIDQVYHTDVWMGSNSSTARTFGGGLDLSNNGGFVQIRRRNTSDHSAWFDTLNGNTKIWQCAGGGSYQTVNYGFNFTNSGYNFASSNDQINGATDDYYVSHTYRCAPYFFDIKQYTGTGNSGLTIAHDLACNPAWILIKKADNGGGTFIHKHGPNGITGHAGDVNATQLTARTNAVTAISTTNITLGDWSQINTNGGEYTVYLWADSTDNWGHDQNTKIISHGAYTGNGSNSNPGVWVTTGFQPQYIMIRNTDGSWGETIIFDDARGMGFDSKYQNNIYWNTTNKENHYFDDSDGPNIDVTSSGFWMRASHNFMNRNGFSYVWTAIRRPDGTVGTPKDDPTKIFTICSGNGSGNPGFPTTGVRPDFAFWRDIDTNGQNTRWTGRVMAGRALPAVSTTDGWADENNAVFDRFDEGLKHQSIPTDYRCWAWNLEGSQCMDYQCWKGDGTNRTYNQTMGGTAEMMIIKGDNGGHWVVYHKDTDSSPQNKHLRLNEDTALISSGAPWNSTAPNSQMFSVGNDTSTNSSNVMYMGLFLRSQDGIQKIGSYTGNNTNQGDGYGARAVTCGFQPRFIMIKRIDAGGHWYVLDTNRGLTTDYSSNGDKWFWMSSTNSQDQGAVIKLTANGFHVKTGTDALNTGSSSNKYIYWAHA